MQNELGLKAPFYVLEDNRVLSEFQYTKFHQSYPERVHGGMITCMLDEIAGRAMWATEPESLAVTTSIHVKFRRPVPYGQKLYALAEITSFSKRGFTAKSQIFNTDGKELASADVTYLKATAEQISRNTDASEMLSDINVIVPDDVKSFDLPFLDKKD